MSQSHILLTGAYGFVGSALSKTLQQQRFRLSKVGRASKSLVDDMQHQVDTIDGATDWTAMLTGIDVVIHLAARVHVMNEELSDPLSAYRDTNVAGTLNLARQSASAGVKRFIFISSIKVNGEQTKAGQPFTADDSPMPEDAYGLSKWEAEQGLLALA
ncbi:MAG: NAD-dependent epimerase/dehydratase family protein, partial [Methylobacillus glycogenes]|nr:NAD-dependent epimerase/dehydratase family protein [Methylobacillus glycogenes]